MILQIIFSAENGHRLANFVLDKSLLKNERKFKGFIINSWDTLNSFVDSKEDILTAVNNPKYMEIPELIKASCCIYGMNEGTMPKTPFWYNDTNGKFYFNDKS